MLDVWSIFDVPIFLQKLDAVVDTKPFEFELLLLVDFPDVNPLLMLEAAHLATVDSAQSDVLRADVRAVSGG